MEQLRDLRVEPVQIERIGVEQRGDRAGLRDVRGERHVVPERVPAVDPAIEGEEGRTRPLRRDDQRDQDGHAELEAAGRGSIALLGRPSPWPESRDPAPARISIGSSRTAPPPTIRQAATSSTPSRIPEQPEQLGDHDQNADREHRVRQHRRRSRSTPAARRAGSSARRSPSRARPRAVRSRRGCSRRCCSLPTGADPPGWPGGLRRFRPGRSRPARARR